MLHPQPVAFHTLGDEMFEDVEHVSGCGIGLILGSPTMLTSIVFADGGGTATYPLPLPLVPGFGPIYSQAFTLCGADPAGFVASPMQQIITCGV